jgi:hypothetical protein
MPGLFVLPEALKRRMRQYSDAVLLESAPKRVAPFFRSQESAFLSGFNFPKTDLSH